MQEFVSTALSVHLPSVLRWAGGMARLLRQHKIALEGKGTGSAGTDALTLADLSLQELIVAALRDTDPIFRYCRIDAEETTGDLAAFPDDAPLTIGIDPIDGTRRYRDFDGDGYSILLHLRTKQAVVYSLVYIPERGPNGWWVEASGDRIVCGPDDPTRPAVDVLRSLPSVETSRPSPSRTIYVNGFRHLEPEVLRRVSALGLQAATPDQLPGCPYELMATGQIIGALVHSPNVYDFPITSHLARLMGGGSKFVKSRQDLDFQQVWLDSRARMLRLPGIVACCSQSETLQQLGDLAGNWNSDRYQSGSDL